MEVNSLCEGSGGTQLVKLLHNHHLCTCIASLEYVYTGEREEVRVRINITDVNDRLEIASLSLR